MKYRSRTDIIAVILRAALSGATKTTLMHRAYLSYTQIQEYIQFLMERDLIMLNRNGEEYTLTEVGLRALRLCDEIRAMIVLDGAIEAPRLLLTKDA